AGEIKDVLDAHDTRGRRHVFAGAPEFHFRARLRVTEKLAGERAAEMPEDCDTIAVDDRLSPCELEIGKRAQPIQVHALDLRASLLEPGRLTLERAVLGVVRRKRGRIATGKGNTMTFDEGEDVCAG